MKRFFILAGGWFLTIVGAILTPIPQPIPLLGIVMCLMGCAILTTHSKPFRRTIQYIRHHHGWLSRALEKINHRMPQSVKTMVHKTRPHAHSRRARMRARNADDAS
jgi:hypothetical protein